MHQCPGMTMCVCVGVHARISGLKDTLTVSTIPHTAANVATFAGVLVHVLLAQIKLCTSGPLNSISHTQSRTSSGCYTR